MNTHIERAVAYFGTQDRLAKAVGVSQAAVHKWLHGGVITAENTMAIQSATNGRVTVHKLRPDIFGPAPEKAA